MTALDLTPGAEIPPFERHTDFANWNRFAAVNDEFIAIHMDDDAGKAAGYSGAIGMGNLQWSYLHNALQAWIGDRGRVVRLSCQFRAPNRRGTTVTARGVVRDVRREDEGTFVDLEITLEDEDGQRLAPGEATVLLEDHRDQEREAA